MLKQLLIIISLFAALAVQAQVSPVLPFLTPFEPRSAQVTDYDYRDTVPSECALIRLPNGKVAYMTRQNGKMKPFYIRAIETGYWDTRYEANTDYDKVFADMREMGANTAYVMIHWEELETRDNHFDFSFADKVVAAAERQQLKLNWILFLHTQANGVPPCGAENAWTFHLDDRDSCNYAMQWPKRGGEIYRNVKTLVEKGGIRPLHVYGHPEVFYRIRRMLYNLAVHYRNSKTVIGVQLGNEEGFSFLDESDHNPVTQALYEAWKLKTNKTDYTQFKKEAINWWWKQFTSAYHEGDPYKILSFNLDAGQAEAEDPERVAMTGTSASTYADGNLDAIGTMFYKQWGYKALMGLDRRYNEGSYNYRLPILIPSEIGIGRFNLSEDFNSFVLHTLERGAQGFGVYCYGEVRRELPDTLNARKTLMAMFANIKATEDLIYAGLPGPGVVQCYVEQPGFQVSHLNVDGRNTLALMYVPTLLSDTVDVDTVINELKMCAKARKAGNYRLTVYKEGKPILQECVCLKEGEEKTLHFSGISGKDVLFVEAVVD